MASRMPQAVRLFLLLFGGYVVILATSALWLDAWHAWDWYYYEAASKQHAPTLAKTIRLVDVTAWYDPADPALLRTQLAGFIHEVLRRNERPTALVLDFYFPRDRRIPAPANLALRRELERAVDAHFPVLVSWDPVENNDTASGGTAAALDLLDNDTVYDHVARGHTILAQAYGDGIFYQSCYLVPNGANPPIEIPALPMLLDKNSSPCAPPQDVIVPRGDVPAHLTSKLGHFPFEPGDLTDKIIVLATLKHDVGPIPGALNPELVTWAISDIVAKDNAFRPTPLNGALAALVLTFSLLTAVFYIAAFQWARRWRLASLRPILPSLAALAAGLTSIGFLFLMEWFLYASLHTIQPQVGLPLIGIIIVAVFSAVFGRYLLEKTLGWTLTKESDWDAFVSYSHRDTDWVEKNVVAPLRSAGGDGLRIFYDKKSIVSSEDWQRKLAYGVEFSRFVIAIYTPEYFDSPFCTYELSRAHRKWIKANRDGSVRPIMLRTTAIPLEFDDIQAATIEDSDAVQRILSDIIESVKASKGTAG